MSQQQIILGIDPGTQVTGIAVISVLNEHIEVLHIDALHMEKWDDHFDRLCRIFDTIVEIIQQYHPKVLAIEAPFYAKNVQSMLKLGRAQGMAIAAALSFKLPVFEYSPKKVKQSVTGNGNAAKEQVAAMLGHILKTKTLPQQMDATDALAVAICHHYQQRGVSNPEEKKHSSWESFAKAHPEKIKKAK